MRKIINEPEIRKWSKRWKDKQTVLVGGCFDIFHYGHLQFLLKAKAEGNYLIVALESDQFIIHNKKKQPIHTQQQRAEILASLEPVNLVIKLPFYQYDSQYLNLVKMIIPKIIAVVEGDIQLENKKKQAAEIGARVIKVINRIKNLSTSNIIKHATFFGN